MVEEEMKKLRSAEEQKGRREEEGERRRGMLNWLSIIEAIS